MQQPRCQLLCLVSWSARSKPTTSARCSLLSVYISYVDNVETSRFTFSANLSNYTLHDSNLPQYKAAHMQGGASGVM